MNSKKKGKNGKPRKLVVNGKHPRINIMALDSKGDFDFMPHLEMGKNLPSNQKKIIQELKDGSYQPFMKQSLYKAEIDPKTKALKTAAPESDSIFRTTSRDSFDFTGKEYIAEFMKEKDKAKTRLDITIDSFAKINMPIYPRYYHNPLQYFDHILLADGYTNSFGGTVMDLYVDFIMPKTLKPVLKLRNPDSVGDAKEQQKVIEKNQEIIEKLIAVDNSFSDDGPVKTDRYLGMPLQQKFKAMILNALTYGRNCIVFENYKDIPHFKWKGKEIETIPNVLKNMQSIDMGMIEYDVYTGKLGGIWMYNQVPFIPADNMIYLVNKFQNPMIGSMYYGFSLMQRAIDPIRLYRRILAQNFQQFIRTAHSGMVYLLFDSTQYPDAIRQQIRTQILSSYKAGEVALIDYANINDFKIQEVSIQPQIQGLMQLQESLVKIIISIMGVPQSLIFDEAAANRATLVGKVVSFLNNQITQIRNSFGDQIASQWYMKNFRILYKDQPKILEMFTIGVQFEEMELETKTEKIERLLAEVQLNPLKDEYIGEELGDASYLDHIDTDKRDKKDQMAMNDPLSKFKPQGSGQFKVENQKGDVAKVSKQAIN